jgi:hypothetical protein
MYIYTLVFGECNANYLCCKQLECFAVEEKQ